MSTGKRLAKRSIIGTRVCAPGDDGKYYSGVISAVNTPASPQQPELAGLSITPNTRYSVRFDPVPAGSKAPDSKNEYSDRDLIGPGFGSVTGARLVAGQKVYLTYNGREIQAEVSQHREHLDEVDVVIAPTGQEGTMSLTKRIDEVRLLESRKSARLADSDTDFARLADMGSDRKRASSHSIDVPQVIGSRKRRPSSSNDSERSYNGWNERTNNQQGQRENCMDECAAAIVLMSLSTPPKNSLPLHCQQTYGSWDDRVSSSSSGSHNRVVVGSPGVGGSGTFNSSSSSSSSSASWRSGTPSPPLSDEGALWPNNAAQTPNNAPNNNNNNNSTNNNNNNNANNTANHSVNGAGHHHHQAHPTSGHNNSQRFYQYHNNHPTAGGSSSSSPNFTTHDEGIVPDLDLERPRKKKIRCRVESDEYIRGSPNTGSSSDNDVKSMTIYKCTWRDEGNRNVRCGEVGNTWEVVAEHVLRTHLNGKKTSDNEEDFYIVDEQLEPACSPPTKSHWDMVRPRSEDPEYQKQLRLAASPAQNSPQIATAVNPQDIVIRDVFSMASPSTPSKQFKPSPRPLQAYNASNISVVTVSLGKMPHSPRRVRGETKKCRKVYGMEHKDLWCTQCKWKKACTRFND